MAARLNSDLNAVVHQMSEKSLNELLKTEIWHMQSLKYVLLEKITGHNRFSKWRQKFKMASRLCSDLYIIVYGGKDVWENVLK